MQKIHCFAKYLHEEREATEISPSNIASQNLPSIYKISFRGGIQACLVAVQLAIPDQEVPEVFVTKD